MLSPKVIRFIRERIASSNKVAGIIVHFGADSTSNVADYKRANFQKIYLINGDSNTCEHLESFSDADNNIEVLNAVVAENTGVRRFYRTNHARFDSLHNPKSLQDQFPNLKLDELEEVNTVSAGEILGEFNVNSRRMNVLVIDVGAIDEKFFTSFCEKDLEKFTLIVVRTSLFSASGGGVIADDESYLNVGCFDVAFEDGDDYPFVEKIFIRDDIRLLVSRKLEESQSLQLENHRLRSELERLSSSNELSTKIDDLVAGVNSRLERLEPIFLRQEKLIDSIRVDQKKKLDSLQLERLSLFNELSAKIDDLIAGLNNKLERLEPILLGQEKLIDSIRVDQKKRLDFLQLEQSRVLSKLEGQDKQFDAVLLGQKMRHDQAVSDSKNLLNRLSFGLSNAVTQVEAFVGLQNYFSDSSLPLSFHGWPISSDIAVLLLSKLEKNQYDLVIEFGSGTSTVLFAKALKKLSSEGTSKQNTKQSRVVTFEHLEKYRDKTLSELQREEVDDCVELVHAPLVDQSVTGSSYKYYSCNDHLEEISKRLGAGKKIMVLVDGPPGVTGPHARYPAVPLLLEHLGAHQLDIFLDDYARKEEKEVAAKWRIHLKEIGVDFEEEELRCEKGAYFCRINPQ